MALEPHVSKTGAPFLSSGSLRTDVFPFRGWQQAATAAGRKLFLALCQGRLNVSLFFWGEHLALGTVSCKEVLSYWIRRPHTWSLVEAGRYMVTGPTAFFSGVTWWHLSHMLCCTSF